MTTDTPLTEPAAVRASIDLAKLSLERELREQIQAQMPELVTKGLDTAQQGDPEMLRYFLDRRDMT